MLFTKTAIAVSALFLLASAQEPDDALHNGVKPGLSRTPTTTINKLLKTRDLDKRCTGSCEECFGDGYTLCPSSSIYCYLPGDAYYGLDSCTSSSSSYGDSTSTADASTSTSTSTGIDDICYQSGATCTSCFGPTYQDCPDGYHCYDPNDPQYDTCPDDDGSSSSSSSSTSSSSCASDYGSGSIPCGDDGCYNPDEGDVCCADGYHCEDGYTCSTIVGKCCAPGSSSSSCSSSGSGSGSGLLSTTSSLTSTRTTSTSGLTFTSATSTATGSSSTGVQQFTNGGNGGLVGVQKGLLLAAGIGAFAL